MGKWAYNWLCSMSNNLNHETLNNVLHACRPAFKRDIKTMIFALPYIVCELRDIFIFVIVYYTIYMYI